MENWGLKGIKHHNEVTSPKHPNEVTSPTHPNEEIKKIPSEEISPELPHVHYHPGRHLGGGVSCSDQDQEDEDDEENEDAQWALPTLASTTTPPLLVLAGTAASLALPPSLPRSCSPRHSLGQGQVQVQVQVLVVHLSSGITITAFSLIRLSKAFFSLIKNIRNLQSKAKKTIRSHEALNSSCTRR